MNKVIHRASTRGYADHGWLKSHHTFSFADYYNPERMHFGALRVLNDDTVDPSKGFGSHPHDNMEIVSIPLEGELRHKDSMGNTTTLKSGEIQVMTAGTGIVHSEFNNSDKDPVKFLQIWIFPDHQNFTPEYSQVQLSKSIPNQIRPIVSPEGGPNMAKIHQSAWLSTLDITQGEEVEYRQHQYMHGVYIFILEGEVRIDDDTLQHRDGMGIWEADAFKIAALTTAKVLIMEVPM